MKKLELELNVDTTDSIIDDVSKIINQSRQVVYRAIDVVLVQRNWLIGRRIHEEELKETRKENYGMEIINTLAKELTAMYGIGFSYRNLYYYYRFYTLYKNILNTVCSQSFLSWSHYRLLIFVDDKKARDWYEKEAIRCNWSVRTLQRNINTQYYYRLLSTQAEEQPIDNNIEDKIKALEYIKNPAVLDFLNLPKNEKLYESDLEEAIILNLNKMLIELGKGYAFVGRQYHIHTEAKDYYVDLVFYNFILKCFVLIDLKVGRIEHKDIGQMDMYVRMFDEFIKDSSDNPTLGIVLCSDTDEDIARYSVLKGNEQLFASKYKLYLPSEVALKAEIEYQKELYYLSLQEKSGK